MSYYKPKDGKPNRFFRAFQAIFRPKPKIPEPLEEKRMARATIVKAELSHVSLIGQLWREFGASLAKIAKKEPLKTIPFNFKGNAPQVYENFAREKIQSPDSEVFIAYVDGQPAGYTLIYLRDFIPPVLDGKIGHINELFVREEYQGQGVASQLNAHAMEWFLGKGAKYVTIQANVFNRHAHSVYEKWGLEDYFTVMKMNL